MALSTGTRIGPYEVIGSLGAGGMGEVYRARDTKLNREVAIKVLPDSFASDPDRLARFTREAQTLASLNHPNIAHIHGLEESSGLRGLVMELVEGEDLSQRIARGAIPVDEALPIAKQIAEALEAAHEQGIIHRDLKPANIKVRPDGTVKVLDFGLAKALQASSGAHADVTASPTITSPAMMTSVGMILGTAAYMSPEQARGKSVDRRSDVWAFGCVLYEMLTGKRAFEGEDISDTLAAVLRAAPDWTALPVDTAGSIRALLEGCLTKDRRQRIADLSTALFVINQRARLASGIAVPFSPAPHVRLWRRRLAYSAAIALTAAGAAYAAWVLKPVSPQLLTRFEVPLPFGEQFTAAIRHVVALSPDGTRLVYIANDRLNLRMLDQLDATPIQGTESTGEALRTPVFSPDGQWIAFWQSGQLKKVSAMGGAPVTLCAAQNLYGASWGQDDTILYGQGRDGIWRVSSRGGTPEQIVKVEGDEWASGPQLLPGDQAILFTLAKGGATFTTDVRIVAQSLADGARKVLVTGGMDARYLSTGHLVYARQSSMLAVPFDLGSMEVSGDSVSLVENVEVGTARAAHFSVSTNGALAYIPGIADFAKRSLVWVDRQGREESIPAPPLEYAYPRVSPDGTKVALDVRGESNDIWIWDLARQILTRLTFDPGFDRGPVWSPDGRRVAFSAARDGAANIYWQAADGAGSAEALTKENRASLPQSFSPDGKHLVFSQPDSTPRDLGVVMLEGDRKTQLVLNTAFDETNGAISPDGQFLAYESDESGRKEIYVRPFPDVTGGRWQVSNGGGTRPLWSRNGRELFYHVAPGTLMAVDIETGPAFVTGPPQKLFTGPYLTPFDSRTYDVSPDGRRFVMIKTAETADQVAPAPRIVIVQNWFEELKRLVPTN